MEPFTTDLDIQPIIHIQQYKIIEMNIDNIEFKSIEQIMKLRQQLNASINSMGLADMGLYFFVKEGSFLSKKQERSYLYFFQGLNTNPQNMSIFLRDEAQRINKNTKQKLVKAVFVIYDMFTKSDCVIQINIPGNLKIFKSIGGKKDLISNEQIDRTYVSAILRSMWQKDILWGRTYQLFQNQFMNEFKDFLIVFLKVIIHKDLFISDDYQIKSEIKGSHACSILLNFIKEKHITNQSYEIIQKFIQENLKYQDCAKIQILLAEILASQQKYHKSLEKIAILLKKYSRDPYILYYQAKYLYFLSLFNQSTKVLNSIIQYNQFQIWELLAQTHIQNKKYPEALACLNQASKLVKYKSLKYNQNIFRKFQQFGKPNPLLPSQVFMKFPKLHLQSDSPLGILPTQVQQKYKEIIESTFWKINNGEKAIYKIIQNLKYSLDPKRFQELLQKTFQQSKSKEIPVQFKNGLNQSLFIEESENREMSFAKIKQNQKSSEQLPNFLHNDSIEVEQVQAARHHSRNLSIIPQIQSVIQNSNYQEKLHDMYQGKLKLKKEITQTMYKLLTMVMKESQFEKAEYEKNYSKILPIYNKMRLVTHRNNYYTVKMFEIFINTGNYKSILVLVAETLDFYEQKGIKKINKIPSWMQKHIFTIIEEKGLKYLNDLLEKLNFYDEAVVDTIESAKKWKIKGITF